MPVHRHRARGRVEQPRLSSTPQQCHRRRPAVYHQRDSSPPATPSSLLPTARNSSAFPTTPGRGPTAGILSSLAATGAIKHQRRLHQPPQRRLHLHRPIHRQCRRRFSDGPPDSVPPGHRRPHSRRFLVDLLRLRPGRIPHQFALHFDLRVTRSISPSRKRTIIWLLSTPVSNP